MASSTQEPPPAPLLHSLLSTAISLIASYWPILLTLTVILRALYKRYASPLRTIPGPFLASITRLHKFFSTLSEHTNYDHIALHQTYGPLVRIAPNEISSSSPKMAREILAAGRRFYKTDFYGVFPPPENPDIFTETREDVHAVKKKVANVCYSMTAMSRLTPFIDDTIDVLVDKMSGFCSSSENQGKPLIPFDLGNWLHYFAFDVLGEVAFSRPFGFLSLGADVEGAIATIDASQKYNGVVGQIPELDFLLRRNPLWKLVPSLGLDPGMNLITRIALEEMGKRRPFEKGAWSEGAGEVKGVGGGDEREDLLAGLIRGHLKDPEKFGEGDIFAVAHGAIFAGSDSTASSMQSLFYLVLSSPQTYTRLSQEISSAVLTGSLPATGNISWQQAQSLSYFQACLKEAMRLRPAVGLNITRLVPGPDGVEIEGRRVAAGTRVAVNAWVLHRDKEVFGDDADVFRPERWLGDEERARVMERYMFHFGGGSHVCIGRNLALLEINKVVPRLLRDFEFRLVHPGRELKAKATFFVVQEGLEVYLSRRSPAA
ncbi:cytochrome P450 [Xylariaceae sp. FL0255]|nr:cytochrome P450 [Xylariaceae sp. FL0255]